MGALTVFKPKNTPAEGDNICLIASVLQISEFQLFELSYKYWFGRPPGTKQIESIFVDYMYRGLIPFWVRDFVRKALMRIKNGEAVHPSDYGLELPEITPQMKRRGYMILAGMGLFIVLFCYWITHFVGY